MVHRLDDSRDLHETVEVEMTTLLHELQNLDELLEVLALCRPKPVRLEERNDDLVEIAEPPNDVAVQRLAVIIAPPVDVDPATSEVVAQHLERANAGSALDYDELRLHLPSDR